MEVRSNEAVVSAISNDPPPSIEVNQTNLEIIEPIDNPKSTCHTEKGRAAYYNDHDKKYLFQTPNNNRVN